MRSIVLLILLILLSCVKGFSQQDKKIFTYDEFIKIVKENHPMMIRANEIVNIAEGNLMISKGGFDPVVKGSLDQKEYNDIRYYQLAEAGLKVPTWVGANLKLGYTQSIGDYVSAMDKTPANGLLVAGVELPIGQGLFYDKRRASLQKAKIYVNLAENEKQLMINDLIFYASKDYWDWFEKYHQLVAIEQLLDKSEQRLNNVVKSAAYGDKAFLDTLEASIQYQNFKSLYLDARTNEQNSRQMLNVHLWADGVLPLELGDEMNPEEITETSLDLSVWNLINDSLFMMHPKISAASFKINLREVDLKLARENIKPKVNLNYNMLNEPVGGEVTGFNLNDYKFGVDLTIPIFLRSSRGMVERTNAELIIAEAEMNYTEQEVRTKFKTTVNRSKNSLDQVEVLKELVANYHSLALAEQKLYDIGESSLMMLNYREIALLKTELKWIEKVSKSKIAELEIMYAIGQLK